MRIVGIVGVSSQPVSGMTLAGIAAILKDNGSLVTESRFRMRRS